MDKSNKPVESAAFVGARAQAKRKHSIFRAMLPTYHSHQPDVVHADADADTAAGTDVHTVAPRKFGREPV